MIERRKVSLGLFVAFFALATAVAAKAEERLTLVFVGDTGTNASRAPVSAKGGYKASQLLSVKRALAPISPWLKGDVTFANLESVVTTSNAISPRDKMFTFRMHPAGARALIDAGINVFSTANNHAMDFGGRGAGETLRNMESLKGHGLFAWPGLGSTEAEALTPQAFEVHTRRVAISAFGIGGGGLPAKPGEAGTLRGNAEFKKLVSHLENTDADLRILSVHYGHEFAPRVAPSDIVRFRKALTSTDGVSVIVGHHPHVARGIEISDQHLILYGMGNFMHFGTQNMAHFDICRDFGLLARVGLLRADNGAMKIETVEAVPLKMMHRQTRPMTGKAAELRLNVLNYLGHLLDLRKGKARGLRFAQQQDGSGLWCAAGATDTRCKGWKALPFATGIEAQRIASACNRYVHR